MEALAKLERLQTRLLQRISNLESSLLSLSTSNTTEDPLSGILRANGVNNFSFKRVPSDYYDLPLEARRDIVSAASIHHLCKSIVLVNTQAPSNITDCSDRNNSKYYVVVVQLEQVQALGGSLSQLGDPKVDMLVQVLGYEVDHLSTVYPVRLAPKEISAKLTGNEHNAVTCISMRTNIPQSPSSILTSGLEVARLILNWESGHQHSSIL